VEKESGARAGNNDYALPEWSFGSIALRSRITSLSHGPARRTGPGQRQRESGAIIDLVQFWGDAAVLTGIRCQRPRLEIT